MSEVENAGQKGYCLMSFIVGFLLFIILLIYIYQKNFAFFN